MQLDEELHARAPLIQLRHRRVSSVSRDLEPLGLAAAEVGNQGRALRLSEHRSKTLSLGPRRSIGAIGRSLIMGAKADRLFQNYVTLA